MTQVESDEIPMMPPLADPIADHAPAPDAGRRPLRVAIVTPGWPAASFPSGIVAFVNGIVPALRQLGLRVFVLAGELADAHATDALDLGFRKAKPTALGRAADAAFCRLAGRHWSQHWRQVYAIVHAVRQVQQTHGLDLLDMEESFGWAADVARRVTVPVLVRLHGPWCLVGPCNGADLADRTHARRVAREADAFRSAAAVAGMSKDVVSRVESFYGIQFRNKAILPGVVSPPARRWSADESHPDTLLFVGRFDAVKGADVLLRAFAQLARARPHLRLQFVGPDLGMNGMKLADYARSFIDDAGVRSRIEYLGVQPANRIDDLRARCGVCIVASRYETFGSVAIEAMAAGCPLVASNAGGLAEIVQHLRNGLVFQSESPERLAACVARLLDDRPLAARLGAQAALDAAKRYHPLRVARRTAAYYRHITSGAASRRPRERMAQP